MLAEKIHEEQTALRAGREWADLHSPTIARGLLYISKIDSHCVSKRSRIL